MPHRSLRNRLLVALVSLSLLWMQSAPASAVTVNSLAPREIDAKATATPHGVLIEWASSVSSDILGFNIYRTTGGAIAKVNKSLIAGPTLIASHHSPSFAWFDAAGTGAVDYEIEVIDIRGESAGRVAAVHSYASFLPQYQQSQTFGEMSAQR